MLDVADIHCNVDGLEQKACSLIKEKFFILRKLRRLNLPSGKREKLLYRLGVLKGVVQNINLVLMN